MHTHLTTHSAKTNRKTETAVNFVKPNQKPHIFFCKTKPKTELLWFFANHTPWFCSSRERVSFSQILVTLSSNVCVCVPSVRVLARAESYMISMTGCLFCVGETKARTACTEHWQHWRRGRSRRGLEAVTAWGGLHCRRLVSCQWLYCVFLPPPPSLLGGAVDLRFSCHPSVCVHASIRVGCCFCDICDTHWWIFARLLSISHLWPKVNWLRFGVRRLKVKLMCSNWPHGPAGWGVESSWLWCSFCGLIVRPGTHDFEHVQKVLWTRKGVPATIVTADHCSHAELTSCCVHSRDLW